MSFILLNIIFLSAIVLSIILLSVILLYVILLSIIQLCFIKLSLIHLCISDGHHSSVLHYAECHSPVYYYPPCHSASCHCTESHGTSQSHKIDIFSLFIRFNDFSLKLTRPIKNQFPIPISLSLLFLSDRKSYKTIFICLHNKLQCLSLVQTFALVSGLCYKTFSP